MIPNFNTERRNDARIYLPPFYTHCRGYKLSMIVCCNGDGHAKDEYLTVYMSTLKGLYDTSLGWPLNCTINFRIVATEVLNCKISVNSQARVLDDCGFSHYVRSSTHVSESLELGRLQDNCLCIQVCSVVF